ncbi:MAG: hypothetical protein KF718_06835 [Polyangiaceae bacterium]|nr:hypothetical protein [Polyangiaceae bacterium]
MNEPHPATSDAIDTRTAEVVATSSLSPRVVALTLRVVGAPELHWQPGQYVEVEAPGARTSQPLSIACAPDPERPGEFEVAVSPHGGALDVFHGLPLGAKVDVRGPFGGLLRREPRGAPLLLVAAGTGLAPLRALLQQEAAAPTAPGIALLFGSRSAAEILWQGELSALTARDPRFRFEPTLSRADERWTGRRGYVQEHVAELLEALGSPEIYLCGSTEMVRDCRLRLAELGVEPERVVTEW